DPAGLVLWRHAGGPGCVVGGLPVLEHVEVLGGHSGGAPRTLTERTPTTHTRAALGLQAALGDQFFEIVRVLGVRRWDHVPLVVFGQRQQPVHVVDVFTGHTDRLGDGLVRVAAHVDVSHVRAH